jgi:CubicO group peptidase (beta-lactamase class C family)
MKKNLLFLLLLSSLCAFSQSSGTRWRDETIRRLMDTADVSGLCVGMIENGNIQYVKAFGYKNAALHQRNDTATCFYAASLAKSLFAYLVMQLVQEKLIDLDKPLYTYLPKPLPEYENYKDLAGDPRWKLITARHCLDHTTGFPNWRQFNPHGNNKLEIFFRPGEHFAYSGEGISLLQLVVETVTKKGLEELARQRIFKPFGMRRTSFVWQPAFESDYAVGHDKNGDTIPKARNRTAYAAGSMETTVADYTRFMRAVLLSKKLDPAFQRQMLTSQVQVGGWKEVSILDSSIAVESKAMHVAYGLGWGLFASSHGPAFFKEGHLDGWEHYVIAWPAERSALIILCNSSNGESMFKELVEKLGRTTIPWKWEGYWPYGPNAKLSPSVLKPITGEYDGKLKAIITLEGGRLKAVSPTVNLPKTNLYAIDERHFYLKVMDTRIEFVKGPDGKVIKAVLDDEGEHYELKKLR